MCIYIILYIYIYIYIYIYDVFIYYDLNEEELLTLGPTGTVLASPRVEHMNQNMPIFPIYEEIFAMYTDIKPI